MPDEGSQNNEDPEQKEAWQYTHWIPEAISRTIFVVQPVPFYLKVDIWRLPEWNTENVITFITHVITFGYTGTIERPHWSNYLNIFLSISVVIKTRSLTKPALRHTKTVAYTLVCLNMHIT